MKNKIFSIILLTFLSLPVPVWAVDKDVVLEQPSVVNTLDAEIEQKTDYNQPISKRKIAKKFLLAMSGVAISSLTIYFMLTIYNRIRDNYLNQVKTLDNETTLETPNNINSAVKIFLDKTNWK